MRLLGSGIYINFKILFRFIFKVKFAFKKQTDRETVYILQPYIKNEENLLICVYIPWISYNYFLKQF